MILTVLDIIGLCNYCVTVGHRSSFAVRRQRAVDQA